MIKKTAILILCLCIATGVTLSSTGGFSGFGKSENLSANDARVAGAGEKAVIDSGKDDKTEITLLADSLNDILINSDAHDAATIYAELEAQENNGNTSDEDEQVQSSSEESVTAESTTEETTVKETTTEETTVIETTTEKATERLTTEKATTEKATTEKATTARVTTTKAATTKATTAQATVKSNSVSSGSAEDILNSVKLKPDRFLADGDTSNDGGYYEAQWFSIYNEKGVSIEGADKLIRDCIEKITADCDTNYEKVMACYDFVQLQVDEHTGGYGNWLSIYSIFRYRKGTCYDYNYLFMTMMRYLGYNARMARGTTARAGGGMTEHAWAEVIIDGTVYIFDPQVDDAMTGIRSSSTGYTRFCKTYSQLSGKYDKDE